MSTQHHRNVVDLLVLQHTRMRELLDEMLATVGAERRESFEEFVRWLAVHEATEAELMRYPVASP
ncbi:hemerythrin domain-containing protein [Nocardia altamirensis]|uniref:hemerythrin domain-containing protein n=1 Tax=Nocardia altamirensis TaxID=472158 RepID=UPI00114CBC36|nr:hemerythrin domain-containing protein [Nocardia altamirensis]